MGYISAATAPVLSINPSSSSMTVVGDNSESTLQTLVVANVGDAKAESIDFVLTNGSLMSVTGSCASLESLDSGESCTAIIKLGPTTAHILESGTAIYTVTYSGQNVVNESIYADIQYTVQANSQNIIITAVDSTGNESGTGESNNPYIFNGRTTIGDSITLTLTNSGTNTIILQGIINPNSPIAWQIDDTSTCSIGESLAESATCTIIFDNILGQNALALAVSGGIGASYQENLRGPTVIFSDSVAVGTQFSTIPALPTQFTNGTIYVTGHQATVANSVILESAGTSNIAVIVSHTLANAESYAPVVIKGQFEDYFAGTPTMNNCTQTVDAGTRTQLCTLTPSGGTASASGKYLVNQSSISNSALILTSVFSVESSNNQIISINPRFSSLMLRKALGKFVYVLNGISDSISMYNVNQTTGILESNGTVVARYSPRVIVTAPSGKFLYLISANHYAVSMFTIDESTGYLSESSAQTPTGELPDNIVIDPIGRFAYVTNYGSNTVSMYTINQITGVLELNGMIPESASGGMAIDPYGKFFYITNPVANTVLSYQIESDGTLSIICTTATGVDPFGIAIDPSGRFAYVTNRDSGNVSMYTINQTSGVLESNGTVVVGGAPIGVAVDHQFGKYVYVTDGSNVLTYGIESNGTLTLYDSVAAGSGASIIAIEPSGRFLYVSNSAGSSVSMYTINQTTGMLGSNGMIATELNPSSIAIK